MKINREWAMPNKNTFQIQPIKNLLDKYSEVKDSMCIDPFANDSKVARITNDLNLKYDTKFHLDALDFLKTFSSGSISCVLFDPPYSLRQLKECYEGVGLSLSQHNTQSFWTDCKKEIARIVKPNGIVISFGWNTSGIGKTYGFEIEEILIVSHGGHHHDTLVTVERKV